MIHYYKLNAEQLLAIWNHELMPHEIEPMTFGGSHWEDGEMKPNGFDMDGNPMKYDIHGGSKVEKSDEKECPHCGWVVLPSTIICPNCSDRLVPPNPPNTFKQPDNIVISRNDWDNIKAMIERSIK